MKILLVAATTMEIEPTLRHFSIDEEANTIMQSRLKVLVTGVGMTATAFAMGRELSCEQYDLAINAGIAGSFDRALKLAEVVLVNVDCFSEMGAEEGENFLSIDELGFGKTSIRPAFPFDHQYTSPLSKARAITVNRVHGNDESIYETVLRLNPQIESMEGAAFFYSCNQLALPCIQLRAVSNYVERRNRQSWNIPLAVSNLNETLIHLIDSLT